MPTVPNTDPMNPGSTADPSVSGGGILAGAQGASNYTPATISNPNAWNVTGDQTAAGQMQKLADPNSGYFQSWANAGNQDAAARGFTGNSSIGQTAILDSVMRNAAPIATADAATYAKSASYNADEKNQFGIQNLNALNSAGQFNAGQSNQRYTTDLSNATQRYGTDVGAATQRYGTDVGANTQRYSTDTNANTQRYSTDVGANTQLATANLNAATQRYGTDVNANTQLATASISAGTQRYMSDQSAATQKTIQQMSNTSQQQISAAHDANSVLISTNNDAAQAYKDYVSTMANIDGTTTMDLQAKTDAEAKLTASYNARIDSIKAASPNATATYSPIQTQAIQQVGGVDVSQQLYMGGSSAGGDYPTNYGG